MTFQSLLKALLPFSLWVSNPVVEGRVCGWWKHEGSCVLHAPPLCLWLCVCVVRAGAQVPVPGTVS